MRIGDAVVSLQAVNAIMYDNGVERRLPFKVKYKLSRIKEALLKEAQVYEDERVKLIEELGTDVERDGGEMVKEVVEEENLKIFFDKVNEIMETKIAGTIPKLTEEDLSPIEEIDIDISEVQMKAFFTFLIDLPTEE